MANVIPPVDPNAPSSCLTPSGGEIEEQPLSERLRDDLVQWLSQDQLNFPDEGSAEESYLEVLLRYVPVLVSAIDENDRVIFASQWHLLLEGVNPSLSEIRSADELFPPFVLQRVYSMEAKEVGEELEPMEVSLPHKDGQPHVYQIYRIKILAPHGQLICTLGIDITANQHAENSLRDHKSRLDYMAFHDALTGLANRSYFYDHANACIVRAEEANAQLAIMLIDLDRFKIINDSLGHDAGDALLKLVSDVLAINLPQIDAVARLGGDEFVVVFENIRSAEDVVDSARMLLHELAKPLSVYGHEISVTASVGISIYPQDGASIDQLLKHADVAMYKAKSKGKNRSELFIQAMKESAVESLFMENDLRRAIDQHEMLLHYQPQICLDSGNIIGLEALVRWNSKERGMVSPASFIPLAEESGLIEPLGEWVLREACTRFHLWLDAGIDFGKIAVNLSAKQFRRKSFQKIITEILHETRLPPQYLELEITESSTMENAEESIRMIQELRKLGLTFAIDDFGTGYSSLAYLRRFPVQKLKIDRSFVSDIDSVNDDAVIAKSIIDLAHNMSMEVIAEGVERISQSNWLLSRGCNLVQGFYYCRPLSETRLMSLIENNAIVAREDANGLRFALH